jgi:hypothetical protein
MRIDFEDTQCSETVSYAAAGVGLQIWSVESHLLALWRDLRKVTPSLLFNLSSVATFKSSWFLIIRKE